jgi:hypothetical protein
MISPQARLAARHLLRNQCLIDYKPNTRYSRLAELANAMTDHAFGGVRSRVDRRLHWFIDDGKNKPIAIQERMGRRFARVSLFWYASKMFQNTHNIRANVIIEMIKPRTQIVHASLTIATFDESVFGTLAPAKLKVITTAALLG